MSSSHLTQNNPVEVTHNDRWEYIVFFSYTGLEKGLRTLLHGEARSIRACFLMYNSTHGMSFGVASSGEYMMKLGYGFISRGVHNVKALS